MNFGAPVISKFTFSYSGALVMFLGVKYVFYVTQHMLLIQKVQIFLLNRIFFKKYSRVIKLSEAFYKT